MTWSQQFRDANKRFRQEPIFVIESFSLWPSGTGPEGPSVVRLSSAPIFGIDTHTIIARDGIASSGGEVTPPAFGSAFGSFSVLLARDIRPVRNRLNRGSGIRLLVGYRSFAFEEYQTVSIGVLYSLDFNGVMWLLQVRDITSALQSRWTNTGTQASLFHNLPVTTALSAPYATVDTGVTVDSTAGFERTTDGGDGVIKISPSGGSDPFYLKWTSASAFVFSVTASNQFDTTRAAGSIGDTVTSVAWFGNGNVSGQLRKLWTSTGVYLGNGVDDILPSSWGYGLPRNLLDLNDAEAFVRIANPTSGNNRWHVLEEGEQSDGLGWFLGWCAPGGWFLSMRQGQLTVRCANNPHQTELSSAIHITNADLISIDEYQSWAADYPVQTRKLSVVSGDGTTLNGTGTVIAHPLQHKVTKTLPVHTNESNMRTIVAKRLLAWNVRIAERLVITGALHLARLAAGDSCLLTTDMVGGRDRADKAGYSDTPVYVASVSPNWLAGTVRLALYILPKNRTL